MRTTGGTLIRAGVLLLLFVAYQLWGTGISQQRDQRALRADIVEELAPPPAPTPDARAAASPPPLVPPELGQPVGLIRIPKIGVDQVVVEGVGVEELKKGPGRYPETPMPGGAGNAAIAGHRTTYGAPFFRLDELAPGDGIEVHTRTGAFTYEVSESKIVSPQAVEVLDNTVEPRLTLTTCNPRYSAAQRLVVVARLVGAPAPPPTAEAHSSRVERDLEHRTLDRPAAEAGLSGAPSRKDPAVVSGALAVLVWLTTSLVGRRSERRWTAYLLGTPVFLVVLYVFFENLARLLPANV